MSPAARRALRLTCRWCRLTFIGSGDAQQRWADHTWVHA